jgi:hypothetical protein
MLGKYEIVSARRIFPNGDWVYAFRGKSTDEKPTNENIAKGSELYDMDTQKAYMYDRDAQTWVEQ